MNKVFLLLLKILSGLVLGLTVSIIVQVITHAGIFSLAFILTTVTLGFIRLTWYLRYKGLLVINLFFIALFLLFKLYIGTAAG